jgi:alkanesulfonate monooxygenase SsuD/methylene tetrahydromethanopterin reductase-like flavin-dependent oxidoreductase (luciferase family)
VQFGLYLTPQTEGPDEDVPSVDAIVEHVHQGDEAGFASVYLTEHHFDNYNAYCDPILMGARLAPYLKQAWMSFSVILLPLTHPFQMVESFNTIDQLMQGRCIFGLGSAGGGLIMTDGLGRTRPDAGRNASEHIIETMLQAWSYRAGAPPLEVETAYDRGRLDAPISPAPYRQPHPLLARGTNDAATIEKCGRMGWPVMYGRGDVPVAERFVKLYTSALEAGNHDRDLVEYCKQWMAVTKLIYVGETEEEAQRDGMAMLDPYLGQVGFLRVPPVPRRRGSEPVVDHTPLFQQTERIYFGDSHDDVLKNIALVGTPDTVVEKLRQYEAVGMEHLRCWFIFGAHCDFKKAQRSFELFTREVMPRLNPEPIRAPSAKVAAIAASSWTA